MDLPLSYNPAENRFRASIRHVVCECGCDTWYWLVTRNGERMQEGYCEGLQFAKRAVINALDEWDLVTLIVFYYDGGLMSSEKWTRNPGDYEVPYDVSEKKKKR